MNSRHRLPADEQRSSNTASSMMSPETLPRSQNNSGNYQRFRPRNFLPQRSDIFSEAGRLAVDYLISHGLLSSDVLSTSASNNNNDAKKCNVPELREPTPPNVRGKPDQDIIDEGRSSGSQRKPSACCPLPRGNDAGEDGKDDFCIISKTINNNPSEIGTGRDVNLLNVLQQRNTENVGVSNKSKQESTFTQEAVAAEEKLADASTSSKRKEENNFKAMNMNVSNGATDTTCRSELTAFVQNNVLIDASSSGSASEGHNPGGEFKGGKRAVGDDNVRDISKNAKRWQSVSQFHANLQCMDSILDKSFEGGQDHLMPAPCGRHEIEAINQDKSFSGVAMLSKDGATSTTPSIAYSEKQFFPSSFKICDLNLIEFSDSTNEGHDAPALQYSSVSVPGKQVMVDVDLSVGSNSAVNNEYNKYEASDKAIDVVDLEGDYLDGERNFHSSSRRTEFGFTSLDNFPNHVHSSNYNPDTQDGYGLMISELIGNDIPSSSVQPETNPLHSDISMHPGDNILSDDDQIYMTLGDIPITGLMRGWDQPNQDY